MRLMVCASVLALLAGAAQADCPPDAPTGLFRGATGGIGADRLEVTLNLVCADGAYRAQLFTSQADYAVTGATGGAGRVKIAFDTSASLGTAELTLDGDTLAGGFEVAGDKGELRLTRTGPPMALDAWTPTLNLTPAQWREDLRTFANEVPRRHANAFFFLPKPAFEAEVGKLERQFDRLNGDAAFVGLQRLANAIGDGHTGLVFPPDRRALPLEVARFGDDVRVVAAGPGLARALGTRLVRIGRTPVGEAWRRALTLTPAEELPELREGRAAYYLTRGLTLHGLGVIPDRNHARLTLQPDIGPAFTMDLHGLAPGQTVAMTSAAGPAKGLAEHHPDATFWCEAVDGQATVYCGFRSYQDLRARAREMFALIDRVRPTKLVIDMRGNGGGDNTEGYRWLILPLTQRGDLNAKGRLFVLIDALTFSAAMNNAAQFQDLTNATLVGQQIGEKPNSYQEPRQFRLPNSHLIVRVSSLYYAFRKAGPNVIKPDREILPSWEDVRAGRDPALAWVLAQPAP